MSSVTYTTPAFLKALGNLAKENQVSNKEFKAKLAHKANRVKQLQCQRKIADQMDKELTKLEKNAANEQAKQDKMDAKQAKIDEKEAKKQVKEAKIAEKEAKKQARVVTTDTDSDENVEDDDVAVKTVVKKAAAKQSKQVNDVEKAAAKQAKDDEKAAAKQAKVDEKAAAKQAKDDEKAAAKQSKQTKKSEKSKQTKKSEKSKAEKNDRADIIRSICEQLGSSDVREQQCRTGKI